MNRWAFFLAGWLVAGADAAGADMAGEAGTPGGGTGSGGGTRLSNSVTVHSSAEVIALGVALLLMLLVAFELGELQAAQMAAREEATKDAQRNYTEVRLLEQDVTDLTSVLIRRDVIKPGDMAHPASVDPHSEEKRK